MTRNLIINLYALYLVLYSCMDDVSKVMFIVVWMMCQRLCSGWVMDEVSKVRLCLVVR
jgi:hypothetical protein